MVPVMRALRSDKGSYRVSDLEIIARHIAVDNTSGCWLWTGDCSNRWGYGRLGPNRCERLAHRLSFAAHVGPIPSGMKVLHRCDVPRCVNPAHLWLGTDRDNMRDMASKGRAGTSLGEANPCSKLTAAQVEAIRAAYASGDTLKQVASRFCVHFTNVHSIVRRKTWAHL